MKSRAVNKYLRRVRRRIAAPRQRREELLSGLIAELEERVAEGDCYDDIVRAFGTPESVAAELEGVLSEEEVTKHRRRAKLLTAMLAVLCVLLLAALIWYIDYVAGYKVIQVVETIRYE